MTKDEVLDGFSFADPAEAEKLRQWLDDATLGTPIRKALVIVGPKCSGKTTLLYRIAEYKGELPCLHDGRGGIVRLGISHGDHVRLYREFEGCKVILVNDLCVKSARALMEIQRFAVGFKTYLREPRSTSKIVEFNISAPLAVAVSADDAERAEKLIAKDFANCVDKKRMPYLLIHPTIGGEK